MIAGTLTLAREDATVAYDGRTNAPLGDPLSLVATVSACGASGVAGGSLLLYLAGMLLAQAIFRRREL